MGKNISFNGYDLQTVDIHTSEISHESADNSELQIERLGARDGGRFISAIFAPKVISIKGTIRKSTTADLEKAIDELKMNLQNHHEVPLDIQYENGIRRYIASCRNVKITRLYYHVTFCEFSAEFVVSNPPFGMDPAQSTISYNAITTLEWEGSPVFSGTYKPSPLVRITVSGLPATIHTLTVENVSTGESIHINKIFADGDVVNINTFDFTITDGSGNALDYNGIIPEFAQGQNDIRIYVNYAMAYTIGVKYIYNAFYL